MALIHWWPLNGNTKDYGLNPINLTNNGATVNNSGKIGKCYSFNGSSSYLEGNLESNLFAGTGHPFSICFWLKFSDSLSDRKIIFGNYGVTSTSDMFNLEMSYGSESYNGKLRFDWRSSPDHWFPSTGVQNVWQHYAVVYDGVNSISLYMNGTLIEKFTATLSAVTSTKYYFGRDNRTGSTALQGYLNDFRIYDHALTPKEVKEISKALVLHYDFEDEDIEGTTNLVTGLTAGGRTSISNNSVITNGENSDTYFYLKFPSALVKGTTYTISCDAEIPGGGTGTEWKFGMGSQSASDPNFIIKDGHNEYTFVCTTNSAKSSLLFNDISRIYGVSSRFYNFQVEQKDHATPFVNGTRQPGLVYDSSGLNNNSINNPSSLQIKLDDSGVGRHSAYFDNTANSVIACGRGAMVTDAITVSIWAYMDNWANYGRVVSCTEGGGWNFEPFEPSNSNLNWPVYVAGVGYKSCVSTKTLASLGSGWHLITGTYDGIDSKLYIDGILDKTLNCNSSKTAIGYNTTNGIFIGGEAAGSTTSPTSPYFNGRVSDFKIYATALSAADVKALYNETWVPHPMQFLVSNSSTLSSLTSSNPVLADGELVVVRSTDSAGKTYFNIRKGNGVNNFNSLPWKQISETVLKGWRDSFSSDSTALTADTNSYTQLGGALIDKDGKKYYQVDYIENTSDSFIQTDYLPRTSVTEMEVQFKKIGTKNTWSPIVNAEDDIRYGIMCSTGSNNDTFACWIGSPSNFARVDNIDLGTTFYQKNTFKISHEGFYINGSKVYTPSSSAVGDYTASWGICVGARQCNDGPGYSGKRTFGRWYLVKFSENGKIVRNYVPVKSADSDVYGLFDTINNKFFSSKTSNGFIGGFEEGR